MCMLRRRSAACRTVPANRASWSMFLIILRARPAWKASAHDLPLCYDITHWGAPGFGSLAADAVGLLETATNRTTTLIILPICAIACARC